MICSVCKKGFAKPPAPCDRCGQLVCSACKTRYHLVDSAAEWMVSSMPETTRMARVSQGELPGTYDLCKNCVAEKVLTEP